MNRLKQLGLALLALVSLSTQALVKNYQYSDGDRLRQLATEPVKVFYQHDSAGNRNTKLILKESVTTSHTDIALDLAQTDLNSADPNSETPLQWQLQGRDQNQLWQYMVSLYKEGKTILQQAGSSVSQILLPILESGTKYDLKLEAENAYHGKIVLENEIQTINHPPSKPSLSIVLNAEHQYEAQWDATDPDVLDAITYTLEVQGLVEDKTQWSVLYQGPLTTKTIPLSTPGLAGRKQLKFRVSATDGKSIPVYSDLNEVEHNLITFDNAGFDALYFWPANPNNMSNQFYAVPENQLWKRHQKEDGNWVLRIEGWADNKQCATTITYAVFTGEKLFFNFARSAEADLHASKGTNYLYDFQGSIDDTAKGLNWGMKNQITPGANYLGFRFCGKKGDWAEIDNLIILGKTDSDEDGLNDAFEIQAYSNLTTHSLETVSGLDTDGDGLTDLDERAKGLNPKAADTDGDHLLDGWELEHQFDPFVGGFWDAWNDKDGDGVRNYVEWWQGSDPNDATSGKPYSVSFDNDTANALYFWPANPNNMSNQFYAVPENQLWKRHQKEDGNWVLRIEGWADNKQCATTITYAVFTGEKLFFNFARSAEADLHASKGTNYLYDFQGSIDDTAKGLNWGMKNQITPGANYLGFRFCGKKGDWAEIDNLIILGKTDSDEDGLNDAFEIQAYSNLTTHSLETVSGLDTDGDGLTDLDERAKGLNPKAADTDGDHLLDGWELEHQFDPFVGGFWDAWNDKDGDGVRNYVEWWQGSDPNDATSGKPYSVSFDNDTANALYFWPANPNNMSNQFYAVPENQLWKRHQKEDGNWVLRIEGWADNKQCATTITYAVFTGEKLFFNFARSAEADLHASKGTNYLYDFQGSIDDTAKGLNWGMKNQITPGANYLGFRFCGKKGDWAEIDNLIILGKTDSDEDGLNDAFEIQAYSNLTTHSLETVSGLDTDGDGLTDLDERAKGLNPKAADTDGDHLLDGWELEHQFDPFVGGFWDAWNDKDGDGVRNYVEWWQGSDPNDATSGKPYSVSFDNDTANALYFWPANPNNMSNQFYAVPENQLWKRHQKEDGNWVLRIEGWADNKQCATTITYAVFTGEKLFFNFARSAEADLHASKGTNYLYDFQGSIDDTAKGLNWGMKNQITPGANYLGFRFCGKKGDWAEIDNLIILGKTDSDEDGLNDAFEIQAYSNLTTHSLETVSGLDTDGDGLTDLDERAKGLNPKAADTDGDHLLDGWELEHQFDPFVGGFWDAWNDKDGDGVRNYVEWWQGSDPNDATSGKPYSVSFDNDTANALYFWPANPNNMSNQFYAVPENQLWKRHQKEDGNWVLRIEGWADNKQCATTITYAVFTGEKLFFNFARSAEADLHASKGTNYLYDFQGSIDDTAKGLNWGMKNQITPGANYLGFRFCGKKGDWAEIDNLIILGKTDSDEDGLNDAFEIQAYSNLTTHSLETVSGLDTDGDGLTDLQEMALGSNALHIDSDADGVSDFDEYQNGTSPITANE